jgi:hypothetical protein
MTVKSPVCYCLKKKPEALGVIQILIPPHRQNASFHCVEKSVKACKEILSVCCETLAFLVTPTEI